jgi:anthranilate synthase component 1
MRVVLISKAIALPFRSGATTIATVMRRYFPDIDTFRSAAQGADVVPVYRQLLADHLTPVTAFEVLGRDDHAFLLESVVGGERIARYSFIATSPALVYQAASGRASIARGGRLAGAPDEFETADPLADLQKLLPRRTYRRDPGLPAFTGGLVGYAGYDTIRYYEGEKLPKPPRDDRKLPDVLFGLYNELVVFDHVDKTIKVIANAISKATQISDDAYKDACRRIDELVARLQQPPTSKLGEIDPRGPLTLKYESNFTREQFEAAVRTGQEYIKAGDIFQFVPSQRLRVPSRADPFDVYRALRIINPSPFMFYLKSPTCTLIGSSPEILCRVEGKEVTTRPLAGTRRRGATEAEDEALEKELLADPKERAEHIMLVDLHRNDIGRVSRIGSVKVGDVMSVERYSHVMHITTNVTGELAEGQTSLDALRVSLPVGTVSGAPKIRAMQIIDELEPTRRGPYGGAVGYLDFAGDMDTCIALRTIVWRNGTFDVQAGAGVVADSVPAAEFEETMNKARAMLKAVQLAEEGF